METQIKLLQENIKRLEYSISMAYTFQKGCQKSLGLFNQS